MLGLLVDKDLLMRLTIDSFLQWKEEVFLFPVMCFTSEKDEAKFVVFALENTWTASLKCGELCWVYQHMAARSCAGLTGQDSTFSNVTIIQRTKFCHHSHWTQLHSAHTWKTWLCHLWNTCSQKRTSNLEKRQARSRCEPSLQAR